MIKSVSLPTPSSLQVLLKIQIFISCRILPSHLNLMSPLVFVLPAASVFSESLVEEARVIQILDFIYFDKILFDKNSNAPKIKTKLSVTGTLAVWLW